MVYSPKRHSFACRAALYTYNHNTKMVVSGRMLATSRITSSLKPVQLSLRETEAVIAPPEVPFVCVRFVFGPDDIRPFFLFLPTIL